MRISKKALFSLFLSLLLTGVFFALSVYVFPHLLETQETSHPLGASRILLLFTLFLTLFLSFFLLAMLRQDPIRIVQNRLKQLYLTLIEQLYELKGDMDWSRWRMELEQRRDDVKDQVKQGLKALSEHQEQEIDALINNFWTEFISLIRGSKETDIDEDKLQLILNRIKAGKPSARLPQAGPRKAEAGNKGAPLGLLRVSLMKRSQIGLEASAASPDSGTSDSETSDSEAANIIIERGGVHYVSPKAFSAATQSELPLNREFKDLVDSVL